MNRLVIIQTTFFSMVCKMDFGIYGNMVCMQLAV